MAYQALYRVYRSQTFDDIVGQEAITKTLKNAIVHHQISHAYLFSGPRGTGKTSCAKILAKAVNCLHPKDGEPCNQCEICQAINENRLPDVVEIDAASNNGVEEIREIREKVNYAPTQAKYKVYIIDEVHMLSKGAFNALLKTLEEPPQNVIFILATTEPHKIPATIVSRTQRFDFRRIRECDIIQHMKDILNDLNLSYEDEALSVIARVSEGGMRDALSILDQVISFSDQQKITLADAMDVTGSLTYEMMDRYLQACLQHDTATALSELESILTAGKESFRFVEDMLMYCRDLLIYQQAPTMMGRHVSEAFQFLAKQMPTSLIYQYIDLFTQAQHDMKLSLRQDVYLEVVTVKLAQTESFDAPTIEKLQQEVHELQKQIQHQPVATAPSVPATDKEAKKGAATFKVNVERVEQIMNQAKRHYLDELQEAWPEITDFLTNQQRALVNAAHPVAASESGFILAFDYALLAQQAKSDAILLTKMQEAAARILKRDVSIEYISDDEWQKMRQRFIQDMKSKKQQDSDIVTKATSLFGNELVEVRDD